MVIPPLSAPSFTGLNVGQEFQEDNPCWQDWFNRNAQGSHKRIELDGGNIVFPPGLATRYRHFPLSSILRMSMV